MMVKTVLDARELAFLIRQIDEYIQVMEVLIRKTPLWIPENSHCRGISGKSCLSANRPNVGERAFPKSLARRRSAGIDDGVPDLGNFHNAAVRWSLNWS